MVFEPNFTLAFGVFGPAFSNTPPHMGEYLIKPNHILGQRRQQKLRLALIFNPTTQRSVVFKNRGARAKLKILKLTVLSSDFRLRVKF